MLRTHLDTLGSWRRRRWVAAAAAAVGTVLFVGLPTVLIPNPVFGREVPTTWWNWPALLVAAALGGLLVATYVREEAPWDQAQGTNAEDRANRGGVAGGVLTFFAVGCPVCNKVVLLALGSAGAMQWFAPVQPLLAVAAVAALGWALHTRLRGERACLVGAEQSPREAGLRG